MGLIVGFYGGKVDSIIMRVCDFISILPTTMLYHYLRSCNSQIYYVAFHIYYEYILLGWDD